MKTRFGFVSNSSSSGFIIPTDKEPEDIKREVLVLLQSRNVEFAAPYDAFMEEPYRQGSNIMLEAKFFPALCPKLTKLLEEHFGTKFEICGLPERD